MRIEQSVFIAALRTERLNILRFAVYAYIICSRVKHDSLFHEVIHFWNKHKTQLSNSGLFFRRIMRMLMILMNSTNCHCGTISVAIVN